MRAPDDEKTKAEIKTFYERLQELLDQRGMRWSDLARLLGLNPKTLSSMKSQLVNPSFTTVRRIAEALDVSLDEFIMNDSKTDELHDLYWAIPRYIENKEIQAATCRQMLTMTYVTGGLSGRNEVSRLEVIKDEMERKLKIK